jgi:hypothetical protein
MFCVPKSATAIIGVRNARVKEKAQDVVPL